MLAARLEDDLKDSPHGGRPSVPGCPERDAQAGKATEATTTLAKPTQHAVQNRASWTSRSVRTQRKASRMSVFMPASVGRVRDDSVTARDTRPDP